MKRFDVEWDDFSGGHFVGSNDVKQPRNTWTGNDIAVTADKGYLVATAPLAIDDVGSNPAISYVTLASDGVTMVGAATSAVYYRDVLGWSSTAITGATATGDRGIEFQSKILFPGASSKLVLFNLATNAVTTATTSASFVLLGKYKEWAVGVSYQSNRLFFSAPADPTSWTSTNYIDLGSSTAAINALVDMNDALYVGTTEGWFAVSGVLGSTATTRFIAATNVWSGAARVGESIITAGPASTSGGNGPLDGAFDVLSGSAIRGSHFTTDAYVLDVVNWGSTVVARDYNNYLWVYEPVTTRAWTRITGLAGVTLAPSGAARSNGVVKVTGGIALLGGSATNPQNASATVALADYQANRPFTVTELFVEVALGTTASSFTRSIGVSVKAPVAPIDYQSDIVVLSANSTPVQTYTFPAMSSTSGQRAMIRFSPNSAGPTFSLTPSLTLQGVMVRRVIARCQEVG